MLLNKEKPQRTQNPKGCRARLTQSQERVWQSLSWAACSWGTKAVLGHSLALASQGSQKQYRASREVSAICHLRTDNQMATYLKEAAVSRKRKGFEKSLLTSHGALLLPQRWLRCRYTRQAEKLCPHSGFSGSSFINTTNTYWRATITTNCQLHLFSLKPALFFVPLNRELGGLLAPAGPAAKEGNFQANKLYMLAIDWILRTP